MSTAPNDKDSDVVLGAKRRFEGAEDTSSGHAEKKVALDPQASRPHAGPLDPFRFCTRLQPSACQEMRAKISELVSGGRGPEKTDSLPGPQPFTLMRANIPAIQSNEYYLCEKSDGQRVMLFVTRERACLVDRKFAMYQINDPSNSYTTHLSGSNPGEVTLVDGELIENAGIYTNGDKSVQLGVANDPQDPRGWVTEPLLVLFDTIVVKGERTADGNLLERLRAVAQVKGPIRELIDRGVKLPLRIESKEFRSRAELARITNRIKQRVTTNALGVPTTHYVYQNPEKGILSLNDGVILTPVQNNYMHKLNDKLPIYKFKWPGLHTVDFSLMAPFFQNGELMLFTEATSAADITFKQQGPQGNAGGGRGRSVRVLFKSVKIKPEEKQALQQELAGKSEVVAEMAFDIEEGRWKVKHLRHDKNRPNFMLTVSSTLEAMAEGLSIQELGKLIAQPR